MSQETQEPQDQRKKSNLSPKGAWKREEHRIRKDAPSHWTGDHFAVLPIFYLQKAGNVDAITADSVEESFAATWKRSESLELFR